MPSWKSVTWVDCHDMISLEEVDVENTAYQLCKRKNPAAKTGEDPNYNTWDSNVPSHRSTNQGRTWLTSLSGREAEFEVAAVWDQSQIPDEPPHGNLCLLGVKTDWTGVGLKSKQCLKDNGFDILIVDGNYQRFYKAWTLLERTNCLPLAFRTYDESNVKPSDQICKELEPKREKNCSTIRLPWRRQRNRYFEVLIHVLLRRLRNKHNLRWLRISMSYHRFNNLRELFQGHLNSVIMKPVESEDYRDRPCNCPGRGSCRYNNACRKGTHWLRPTSGSRVPVLDVVGPKKWLDAWPQYATGGEVLGCNEFIPLVPLFTVSLWLLY